jgi:hypothetical protein
MPNVRQRFAVETDDVEAIIPASLLGTIIGGLVMQLWEAEMISEFGALIGVSSLNAGWLVLLIMGLVLGLLFVTFVAGSINSFVSAVMMLSSKSTILQKILVPLLNRSALGTTTLALGLIYGLVIGIIFYLLIMPLWLSIVGVTQSIPRLSVTGGIGVLGLLLYGAISGLLYGLVIETWMS